MYHVIYTLSSIFHEADLEGSSLFTIEISEAGSAEITKLGVWEASSYIKIFVKVSYH